VKNVTGGQCGYGSNQYGSQSGNTQWFYSSLSNPNSQTSTAPGGGTTGTNGNYPSTKDCSLQVIKGNTKNGVTTYASPKTKCFSGSCMTKVMTNAAPSCSGLNGNSYHYAWNDMGGNPDDLDYNDLVFNFSCSGGSGSGNGTGTTGGRSHQLNRATGRYPCDVIIQDLVSTSS
jgi:hypothetical protein